jgi:hypothetical protein
MKTLRVTPSMLSITYIRTCILKALRAINTTSNKRHAPPQTYENIIISKNGASLAHALRNIARGDPGNKMALDVPIFIIGQTTSV